MKICAITTWPPHRDGVALYSAQLYAHMAELVDVKVIANIPEEQSAYEQNRAEEAIVLRCWRRGNFAYPLRIFRSTLRERPNLIHLQHGWLLYGNTISSNLFLILLLLFRLSRKPCIVTVHTVIRRSARMHDNRAANFLARMAVLFISRFIVKASDSVIVHNHLMKKVLQTEYALQEMKGKIFVIPHGVKSAPRKSEMSRKGGETWILCLGFVREKRVGQLISGFQRFLERCPDGKLFIAGGRHAHDKADHIERLKRSLTPSLSKHVFFTNFIDEKSLDMFICKSDIVVLPSVERYYIEASGALARVADYGKPIVCSRVPKFETELENGEDCIMISPDDSGGLAEPLALLKQNAQLREKLGQNLREKSRSRRWSAVAKQHLRLYRSIWGI